MAVGGECRRRLQVALEIVAHADGRDASLQLLQEGGRAFLPLGLAAFPVMSRLLLLPCHGQVPRNWWRRDQEAARPLR